MGLPNYPTREEFEEWKAENVGRSPHIKDATYEQALDKLGVPKEERTGMLETIGRSIPAGIASGIKRVGETAETGISELQKLTPDFVDTLLNAPKFVATTGSKLYGGIADYLKPNTTTEGQETVRQIAENPFVG
ncbi:hypothetical protein MCHI_001273, partial [Candidatus Magnetoovum chiemensis]